ncbi:MAG: hypothetical protein QN229_00605 [Desulfurococcaceae archaeon TW002]
MIVVVGFLMIKSFLRFVEGRERIDFFKLFYPSFLLPLVSISGDGFEVVKEYGYCRGTKLVIKDNKLYALSDLSECLQYSQYLSGSWFDARNYLSSVSEGFRNVVERLLTLYGDLGIPTSPLDELELFTTIILSRNTDYHRNTVGWVKKLLKVFPSIDSLINAEPEFLTAEISSSYQVRELPRILDCYLRLKDYLRGSSENSRVLLRCSGVGPKTLYAYILFIKLDSRYAPIDTNLLSLLSRLRNLRKTISKLRLPVKEYCLKHSCDSCLKNNTCIEAFLKNELGPMNGWFQTMAFLHNKTYCISKKCVVCPLSKECLST